MHPRLAVDNWPDVLAAVLDEFPGPVWLVNRQGHIVGANRRAEIEDQSFGGRSDGWTAKTIQLSRGPGDVATLTVVQDALNRDEPIDLGPVVASQQSKRFGEGHLRAIPLRRGLAEPICLLAFVPKADSDETQASQACDQYLVSLSQMAARIAHEVNNPLDGSIRFINLALRRLGDETSGPNDVETLGEYLSSAREALVKISEILSDVARFSQGGQSAGKAVPVNELIEQAIKTISVRAQTSRISIVTALDDGLPLRGSSKLYQVFCNLAKNAVESIEARRRRDPTCPGLIVVRSKTSDNSAIIEFEDSGIGLEGKGDSIFEPFVTTKSDHGGTGLGLAIVKEIVTGYEGRIWAEARRDGGTRFVVELPASLGVQVDREGCE